MTVEYCAVNESQERQGCLFTGNYYDRPSFWIEICSVPEASVDLVATHVELAWLS